MIRILSIVAAVTTVACFSTASEAYYVRPMPQMHFSAPAPRYIPPPVYRAHPAYQAPRIYTQPARPYSNPQQHFQSQPHYGNPQGPRYGNLQTPRGNLVPARPMEPAVIMPHPRGVNAGPGRVFGFVHPRMIPSYRPWRWAGGSAIVGSGAYYYFNTADNVVLMPSGMDNSGPAFDIEAFIRLLNDDGTAPDGDPDAINTDAAGELVPE